jgi:hypothetical protein
MADFGQNRLISDHFTGKMALFWPFLGSFRIWVFVIEGDLLGHIRDLRAKMG